MQYVPLFIFTGESNSGGYALNSELATQQPRASLQIFDIDTQSFQALHIGVNNLKGHLGLTNGVTHGWEHGLALSVEAGVWPESYLVKTGQGGSRIAGWAVGGEFFTTMKQRVEAAKAALFAQGKVGIPYIWYTQGINDSIDGTNLEVWKEQTRQHFKNLRDVIGYAPIITCEFPASHAAYNTALHEINDHFMFIVSSDGAGLRDANHWNAQGMELIASRMSDVSKSIGQDIFSYMLNACNSASEKSYKSVYGPVSWTNIQNASATITGSLGNGGVLPSGGIAKAIDVSEDFSYEMFFDSIANQGTVVYLDSDIAAVYQWGGTNPFVSGFYVNAGNFNISTAAGSATVIGPAPAYPFKVRAKKNAFSIDYELDSGSGYSHLYTHTNVLAGRGVCWLKCIIAQPSRTCKLHA